MAARASTIASMALSGIGYRVRRRQSHQFRFRCRASRSRNTESVVPLQGKTGPQSTPRLSAQARLERIRPLRSSHSVIYQHGVPPLSTTDCGRSSCVPHVGGPYAWHTSQAEHCSSRHHDQPVPITPPRLESLRLSQVEDEAANYILNNVDIPICRVSSVESYESPYVSRFAPACARAILTSLERSISTLGRLSID